MRIVNLLKVIEGELAFGRPNHYGPNMKNSSERTLRNMMANTKRCWSKFASNGFTINELMP
jgi:hypothetical protein